MNRTIFKKIFSLTMTAALITGGLNAHAYYLDAGITGTEIINENFEESDAISETTFSKRNDAYSVVYAAEEGIAESSAHGNVVKATVPSGDTASKDLETDVALIGSKNYIPNGEDFEAARKVVVQVDLLIASRLTAGTFDLRAGMTEKAKDGTYSDSLDGNVLRVEYAQNSLYDGTETTKAIEVSSWNWNEAESKHSRYRIGTLTQGQWYTFTIVFEADENDSEKFVRSIWINDELVVDKWQAYQNSTSIKEDKIIQFINGLRIRTTKVNSDIYLDNLKLWTNGSVGEFTQYDGYKTNLLSVTTSESTASVEFEFISYMDARRPVVALAAVYDKRTNKIGRVYYLPKVMQIGEKVNGVIDNIALPQDYNENDYEIKFYIWNMEDIFAPVFIPKVQ